MKKNALLLAVIILILILAGCQGGAPAAEPEAADTEAVAEVVEAAETEVADRGTIYLCGCEGDCSCAAATAHAGTCGCGKELVAHNVIKLEDGSATICGCPGGCNCGAANETDGTKCACGKDLVTVDLVGTGLYACACGPTCCRVVSDEPGDCDCGKPLAQL